MFGKPPDVVPDGLSAEEYLQLGRWYHESQALDLARDALRRALDLDRDRDRYGPVGTEARNFMAVNIPRHEIPREAVEESRKLEILSITAPGKACQIAIKLTESYPDFEWPYRRAAELKLREGDTDHALALSKSALEINPDYAPAMVTIARTHAAQMNYVDAMRCLDDAARIMPDSDEVTDLRRSLEILTLLEV